MIPYLVHQAFKAYSENVKKKKKKLFRCPKLVIYKAKIKGEILIHVLNKLQLTLQG